MNDLPKNSQTISEVFEQLRNLEHQHLERTGVQNGQQTKGLKFISTQLHRLFQNQKKMPYTQVTQILIDNFAFQSSDQRNIKRRVYDAINVMVSASHISKTGDSIQKNETQSFRNAVKKMKKQLETKIQILTSRNENKKEVLRNLKKKINTAERLFEKNKRQVAEKNQQTLKILTPRLAITEHEFTLNGSAQRQSLQLKLKTNFMKSSKRGIANRPISLLPEDSHFDYLPLMK